LQEALFNTYYCYQKLNDTANAARILALMKQKFPSGRYVSLIENPPSASPDQEIRTRATHDYEKIYEDLIEGNFDQALAAARKQKIRVVALHSTDEGRPLYESNGFRRTNEMFYVEPVEG